MEYMLVSTEKYNFFQSGILGLQSILETRSDRSFT